MRGAICPWFPARVLPTLLPAYLLQDPQESYPEGPERARRNLQYV